MNRLDLEQWSVVVRRKNIESEITTPLEQEAKRSSPHRFFSSTSLREELLLSLARLATWVGWVRGGNKARDASCEFA